MKTRTLRIFAAAFCGGFFAASATPITTSYERDASGRVTSVNYGGASNTAFLFDGDGNPLSRVSATNPFIPVAGVYDGLVTGNAPDAANTGTVTITVTAGGMFTGALVLDGVKYAITGSFDAGTGELTSAIVIHPKAPLTEITLNLTIDLTGGTGQITGSLTGGEVSSLTATLSPFNMLTDPVPGGISGYYTVIFPATASGTSIPQGTGYGTLTIAANGGIKFAGSLADGTKVTQGATLDEYGAWPILLPLYKKHGFISGDAAFADVPGVSDLSGSVAWLKPATGGHVYPGAFSTIINVLGSKYAAPPKNEAALEFGDASPNAEFTAAGGHLGVSPLEISATLADTGKGSGVSGDPHHLKFSIKGVSGLISGSFGDAPGTRSFNGVAFQKQNLGAGFFLDVTDSGPFTIEPSR